jgi:transposase
MPQNFLTCDRDQPMLLPPDLRDWLDDDHLAWFVIEAIDELDLEPFYASYRADGHGRSAHEPKMMVTLLAYAAFRIPYRWSCASSTSMRTTRPSSSR